MVCHALPYQGNPSCILFILLIVIIDMREHFVIDPLIGKRQQLLLATQLCRMVLKINNVIVAGSDENEF